MPEDRDVEVTHLTASFVAELRRLADALESSTAFTIHVDGEDVIVPEGARLSVAHEREDGEIELEFQITWSVETAEDVSEADETAGDEATSA
ncbi:MAG: amphi-Trp domain-containing protein [Paracoccaceae bacterium]